MKLTFGKNTLGNTRVLSKERKSFYRELDKDIIHPVVDLDLGYGKFDSKGFVRIPRKDRCRTVSLPGSKPILLLEPVADIVVDLSYYFNDFVITGKIPSGSQWNQLKVLEGLRDVEDDYNLLQEQIYDSFISYINREKNKKRRIVDFETFCEIYSDYLINLVAKQKHVTRTAFYKYGSRFYTSMYVKFVDLDYSDDLDKINRIVNDSGFYAYQDSLKRFGFLLEKETLGIARFDRNIQILEKRDLVEDFENSFYYPHHFEKESLKYWFINSYISFVQQEPLLGKYFLTSEGVKSRSEERNLPDFEHLEKSFDDVWWVHTLWRLRFSEENKPDTEKRKINTWVRKYQSGDARSRERIRDLVELWFNKHTKK